jgi:hypothetical protein
MALDVASASFPVSSLRAFISREPVTRAPVDEGRKRRRPVTPQAVESLWITGQPPIGRCPSVEGTSGAAYRIPLRGGEREATLVAGAVRNGVARLARQGHRAVPIARWKVVQALQARIRYESATRGVRVKLVGVKLSQRAIAAGGVGDSSPTPGL